LSIDDARNRIIVSDVLEAIRQGRSPILLTERRAHLEILAAMIGDAVDHTVVLHGGLGVKQRKNAVKRLASVPPEEPRLLLATGKYIGEGFDDARLDTLFLAMPIAWKGTLIQYTGRLHRLYPAKDETQIFDYVDRRVPMLARTFEKRVRGYRSIGYVTID
jgi:superfamily II DNA or RNA helicase